MAGWRFDTGFLAAWRQACAGDTVLAAFAGACAGELVAVLALDRFTDFSGDAAVAPATPHSRAAGP